MSLSVQIYKWGNRTAVMRGVQLTFYQSGKKLKRTHRCVWPIDAQAIASRWVNDRCRLSEALAHKGDRFRKQQRQSLGLKQIVVKA